MNIRKKSVNLLRERTPTKKTSWIVQKDEEKKIIVDNLVNQPQEVLQGQSI
jgi:hypothetical protein